MNEAKRLVELIPRLRRYARALVGDRATADDLVQDTLERAWAKLHLYRRGTDLRAWLFTVMHNVHVNRVRASRVTDTLEDEMPELAQRAPQGDALLVRDLDRAIARLPAEQRAVLLLVTLEEMSYEEVARTLGIPIGTVMSRLSRARDKLRAMMLGQGDGREIEARKMSGQMSDALVTEADLQAYADGKLPEERRAAVAAWLAAHPEDAERIESYRQLAAELRTSYDGVLDEPVPERLAARLACGPRAAHGASVAGWIGLGVSARRYRRLAAARHAGRAGGRPATPPQRWRIARSSRTRRTRRRCAIRSKSAPIRKRIWWPGCRSASAPSCARRSSKRSATAWSAAGCCPASRGRWRTSCTSATAARA